MRHFKRLLWGVGLSLVLGVGAVSCSSGDGDTKPRIPATPTPVVVAWQRPQSAIGQNSPAIRLTGVLRLHQRTVNAVAFSSNSLRLASVGADDAAVIWNLANGEPLFVQNGNDGRRVFWGPDDSTLITISPQGVSRVWTMNMEPPRQLEQSTEFVSYGQIGPIAQSPDHTLLAYGSQSGGVRLWRIPEGEMIADFHAHRDAVQYLAFSPDGTMLVTIGHDRSVRVWSVPEGALVQAIVNSDIVEVVKVASRAVFSPDSRQLAVAYDSLVEVWHVTDVEPLYTVSTARSIGSSAREFSPDGTLLVACGAQPLVAVWRAADGAQLGLLPTGGQACDNVAFSPDSTLLVTLPLSGQDIYLWNIVHITDDVPTEQKMLSRADRQTMGLPPDARIFDVAWSPDGRFIVVLDELGAMYVLSAVE